VNISFNHHSLNTTEKTTLIDTEQVVYVRMPRLGMGEIVSADRSNPTSKALQTKRLPQKETQDLLDAMRQEGLRLVRFGRNPDVVFVNPKKVTFVLPFLRTGLFQCMNALEFGSQSQLSVRGVPSAVKLRLWLGARL